MLFQHSRQTAQSPASHWSLWQNKTSQVHLGLVSFIEVDDLSELELDPSEFNNIAWLSIPELKQASLEWEAWSDIIVKSLTNEF